jgi:hypothetical protein
MGKKSIVSNLKISQNPLTPARKSAILNLLDRGAARPHSVQRKRPAGRDAQGPSREPVRLKCFWQSRTGSNPWGVAGIGHGHLAPDEPQNWRGQKKHMGQWIALAPKPRKKLGRAGYGTRNPRQSLTICCSVRDGKVHLGWGASLCFGG